MKIGEWWCVFDDKGRAVEIRKTKSDAWFEAWWGHDDRSPRTTFARRMEKRGWTCEKIEIRRPG